MSDALGEQIEAYEGMLHEIKRTYGAVWVLIAGGKLMGTFPEFPSAARHAIKNHGREQVLVRHTDERAESAPYVHVEG